jgi:DNA mismatch repair protein MSH4
MGYLSRHSICIVLQPISPRLPSIGLQYIQKYIMKEGSASPLLVIPTRHSCPAEADPIIRNIETRNFHHFFQLLSTIPNLRWQRGRRMCHGQESGTHRQSVHSERQGIPFGILSGTLTPVGGRLLCSNILQPLTDEKAINSQLDRV